VDTLRRHRWLALLLLVTTVAFARLWWVSFSWDDEALVVDNRVTGSLANFREFFTRDLWGTTKIETLKSGYYRPLMLISLALDRAVFGISSAEAHVHSLLWHLLAVGALYAVIARLFGPALAIPGAALFALHPVQVEVLALVAARNDSMAAALTFLALYAVLDRDASIRRSAAAGALLLLALLSKESAVLMPLVLLGLDLARFRRPGPWQRYVGLAVALAIYVGMRLVVEVGGALVPEKGNWLLIARHGGEIASLYASLLVWPWPLTPARYVHYLPAVHETIAGAVVFTALVVWALWRGRERIFVVAGLAWAFAAFVPSLAATLDKGLLGERYLYLPVAGLALALSAALRSVPRWLVPVGSLVAVAIIGFRLPDWQDSRTVWNKAHVVAPTPFTAAGLGWYLHRDGNLDHANVLLVEALEGDPPYTDACDLVVRSFIEARRFSEAAAIGRWALQERSCNPDGLVTQDYAVALAGTGHWDEAVRVARNRPTGPVGTGLVVVGGNYARQGNLKAVDQLSQKWHDRADYVTRVVKLLQLSGETAAAERLAKALAAAKEQQPSP
jgi:hypothetical protein